MNSLGRAAALRSSVRRSALCSGFRGAIAGWPDQAATKPASAPRAGRSISGRVRVGDRTTEWLTRSAALLRAHGHEVPSAAVIETARLATSLRGYPRPDPPRIGGAG
jgi:hypothetical protein